MPPPSDPEPEPSPSPALSDQHLADLLEELRGLRGLLLFSGGLLIFLTAGLFMRSRTSS